MTTNDDVIAVLTGQHRRLEARLRALLAAAEKRECVDCPRLLAAAGDDLAVHILAKEEIVYPAVHAARSQDMLPASLEEHLALKRLLADLLVLAPEDAVFLPKCQVLAQRARAHHQQEQAQLFADLRHLLDEASRRALGGAVMAHDQALHGAGEPRGRVLERTVMVAPLP